MVPTITAFKSVPAFARGFVRDIRARWAFEEAGQGYAVDLVDRDFIKSEIHRVSSLLVRSRHTGTSR